MGNTGSTESMAQVPQMALPYLGAASESVSKVQNALPTYSNFLSTPQAMNLQDFANNTLGPGGSFGAQNSLYNNVLNGSMLNPGSNPYLGQVMDASQGNFSRTLGGGLDQLASFMNLQGQGPTSSGAFANAAGNLTRNAVSDQSNSMNQMLFGNYQQGLAQQLQQLQAGNPILQQLMAALPMLDLPNTLAMQQTQANAIPANLWNSLLQGLPLATPQYGPSEFSQNFGMAMQGLGAIGGAYKNSRAQ